MNSPTVLEELNRLNRNVTDLENTIRTMEKMKVNEIEISNFRGHLDDAKRERDFIEGLVIKKK